MEEQPDITDVSMSSSSAPDQQEANVASHGEQTEQTTDDEGMEEVRSKISDGGSVNESMKTILSPVHSSFRAHDASSDSKRKFRITGLKHPGEWNTHDKLLDLLSRAEHCHVWFENLDNGVKSGGASLTFETLDLARAAFAEARTFIIDGVNVKLQASRAFYEPVTPRPIRQFTLSDNEELRNRTLYALHLLESTKKPILEQLFEDMETFEILPLSERRNQAEVIMKTEEAAKSAKTDSDGFELNDGEQSSLIRVLTPYEYEEYTSKSYRPLPLLISPTQSSTPLILPLSLSRTNSVSSTSSSHHNHNHPKSPHRHKNRNEHHVQSKPKNESFTLPEIPSNEPEMNELVDALMKIVNEERINWAELTEREELYRLIDRVSYTFGGVRDELLRSALLNVLEQSRASSMESSWMRRHIDDLIKNWKKEMLSDVLFERSTRVPLQSRIIEPLPQERKRKRGGGAALRAQYGIGSILASARAKFATEEGELDIDEDENGIIKIGDVPLSFESWARFNKTPIKRNVTYEDKTNIGEEEKKENRKAKRAKMEEDKKKKKEEHDKNKKNYDKAPKELEEGEMEESEDEEDKKESSSSSSSSSSTDSDDEGKDSRRRRRFRRKNERTKPPSLPPLFQSIYDNRIAIISNLSVEHRVAFSKVLTQFVNQKGDFDASQQKALMTYMSTTFGPSR